MRLPKSKAEILEEEVTFLRAQVAQLQNYILMTGPVSMPVPGVRNDNIVEPETDDLETVYRMHTTEEEEDIEFAREEGLIDEAVAKALLAEAQAQSVEIDLEYT